MNIFLLYIHYGLAFAAIGIILGGILGFVVTHWYPFCGQVYFLGWKCDDHVWREIDIRAFTVAAFTTLVGVIVAAGQIHGWNFHPH